MSQLFGSLFVGTLAAADMFFPTLSTICAEQHFAAASETKKSATRCDGILMAEMLLLFAIVPTCITSIHFFCSAARFVNYSFFFGYSWCFCNSCSSYLSLCLLAFESIFVV